MQVTSVVMGDVGTQTQGLVPLSHGTFVFISTIKNEHASTQCCLPVTSDASTSTDELANYLKPFIGKKCYSVLSSGGKRRGRPRKRNIMTEGTAKHEAASDISEVAKVKNTDEFVHSRVKRERKIPVKFDPSDVNKTKSTSIPASEFKIKCENEDVEHDDENFKFPESDSDWSDEDISKSKAYDSNDDDVESCLQVSNGTNKKCFTMKYLQNSGVEEDEVFHVESAKDDVGECKNARNGVMEKICIASNNINAQGNALGVTLQTYRKKRTLNHPGRKRRARRKQSGGGPYTCEQCHIDFKLISIYTKHMLNHEISQGKHAVTCKVCGKVLSSHVNFCRHMMIHTGKPFTCQICDKGFTGRYLLKEHLIVEHNQITSNTQTQTNHQCHACKKYMSTKTALQYHLSQLHSCEKCEKKWPCRTSLREHVLQVHDHVNVTKEGRLECFQCNKTFSYRHHYLNHVAHHR
ncbi:Zinc finger protein 26-like 8 [Homarus americanus]|uniref:Zinc finger protein 26-like 8 n=1 Tax=Homarus americanus TaxID=6706 RepID=A0A8J5JH20_HOMAM|nr:Zinc finger protein 26-like 8 [Homarus americanus]